ncbi:MAG: sodium:calcium antiporter [Alphaproteobacteria bacterium]|nr:sodium:calcium antiporter [Alphaproteobacteria bacterium]
MAIYLLITIISMFVIAKSCDGFADGSEYLGRNMSDGVRGATINAIGSSMPELLTAIIALLFYADRDGFAFGVGTNAGSAMFNIAIIPGLVILTVVFAGTIKKIAVDRKVILRDGIALILAEILFIQILSNGKIGVLSSLSLIAFYVAYTLILLKINNSTPHKNIKVTDRERQIIKRQEEKAKENIDNTIRYRLGCLLKLDLSGAVLNGHPITTGKAWTLLLLSVAIIGISCHFLVGACYGIGDVLNVKAYFIAVILSAAATSVPDTIISINDARKGKYEDAISNALGSNVFDICIGLGVPAFLWCLFNGGVIEIATTGQGSVPTLLIFLLFSTFMAVGIFLMQATVGLIKGILLLIVYGSFVGYIIGQAYKLPFANVIDSYLSSILSAINM